MRNNLCRLQGKIVLYEYDDPDRKVHLDQYDDPTQMRTEPPAKLHKKGDIYITIWHDTAERDETKQVKWAVAIKGSDVRFVPMMNQLFNRKVTGSQWMQMEEIGTDFMS